MGAIVLLGLEIIPSYLALAVLILTVGTGVAFWLPDESTQRMLAPYRGASGRPSSLRDRNFLWLVGSRLIVNIGNALGTALLLFFLLHGVKVPTAEAEDDLFLLMIVYTVFSVIAAIVTGLISDRTTADPVRRRRSLTALTALSGTVWGVIMIISPSLLMTGVAAAVIGLGYGAYTTVSLALATDLLKDPEDHARDLGIVNVAAQLRQLIAPLLGAGLVAVVGGFWLLFTGGIVLSALGALMTYGIRIDAHERREQLSAAR
ncbi:MFS transporter [Microbacterium esteraromaticum]|uniref:MFS transporter n=1 Tax=Microbacterium esteraromaticum TaxID=57043 RepID=UPI00309A964B